MNVRLDGKVALVTGGSRGIGRAIATCFLEAGARVTIVSRKEDSLKEAAEAMGGQVAFLAANAGDADAGERAVAHCLEQFGQLDILVNNAAANPSYGPLMDIQASAFEKTINVNLRGPLLFTQAAWKHAFQTTPGVVLNISSGGSIYVEPNIGLYNVTKAALNKLTRELALEMAPSRVVCLAPGLTRTDLSRVLIEHYGDRMAAFLPVRRLGEPMDMGSVATFLVSDHAAFITGETFFVDGGLGSIPVGQ